MGILITGIIEGFRSRKDRTIAITIGLNELDPDKLAQLTKMNQEFVKCYLSKDNIDNDARELIDELVLDEDERKTPGQRLRAVIYRIWEQNKNRGKTTKVFTEYYRDYMEGLITDHKEKLD